jgi:predicted membrane protein (TIGR00267 family)
MLEKIRTFAKITKLWAIARRYFVNNFYDGMLTVLGILLGFFVSIIKGDQPTIESHLVILTGVGASISMLISGLTGSYLSEKAEQKKIKEDLKRAMVVDVIEEEIEIQENSEDLKEIEKAMFIKINKDIDSRIRIRLRKANKKVKTLQQKAENFASIIVSFVNGGSPFLGGLIPLIPFLCVEAAGLIIFVISFLIILICIILLGVFLGVVSKESIIKNILQMTFAFFITVLISIFLLS